MNKTKQHTFNHTAAAVTAFMTHDVDDDVGLSIFSEYQYDNKTRTKYTHELMHAAVQCT